MNNTRPFLLAISLLAGSGAAASVDSEELRTLRAEIDALTAKLERLEAMQSGGIREMTIAPKTGAPAPAPAAASPEALKLLDTVSVGGDFRYQYDTIDDARRDGDRKRHQVRLRAGVGARVSEDVEVGFGLATGSVSPVNGNQALGGAGSPKDTYFDQAFFKWQVADQVQVVGGKFKNPHYRPGKYPLMWDGELRPEGAAVLFDNGRSFAYTGVNFLQSDSGANGSVDTESIYSAQYGQRVPLGASKLTVGTSFVYAPLAGSHASLDSRCVTALDQCYGNSLDGEGHYLNDYGLLETFAELRTVLGDTPVMLFGNLIKNLEADDHDRGYALGFGLERGSPLGEWGFRYSYQDLEADAVFGGFTDSVFAGGGTDNSGHLFRVTLDPMRNVQFATVYYLTEYGHTSRDEVYDYERLQMELNLKF